MFFNQLGIKSRNVSLIYFSKVLDTMMFFVPFLALYYEKYLFTLGNVALVFSVEAIATAIFEVPTGAIADLVGRKKTLILSKVIRLSALVFLFWGNSLAVFMFYAVLSALGRSLTSGTDNALIYDTLKEEGKEGYYKKVIGTAFALTASGRVIGAILGGYLAKFSLALPVLITFAPWAINLILVLFLKEPHYLKEIDKNIFKHIASSIKEVIRKRQLIILLVGHLILFIGGYAVHSFRPIFLEFKNIPIIYFGYVVAFTFGFSALGSYWSHYVCRKIGEKITLLTTVAITPIFLLLAVATNYFIAIIFFTIRLLFTGLRIPIINNLINLEIAAGKRATVMSISKFLDWLGGAIFLPMIGYAAEIYTINTAFILTAVLMLVVPILFLFLGERKISNIN